MAQALSRTALLAALTLTFALSSGCTGIEGSRDDVIRAGDSGPPACPAPELRPYRYVGLAPDAAPPDTGNIFIEGDFRVDCFYTWRLAPTTTVQRSGTLTIDVGGEGNTGITIWADEGATLVIGRNARIDAQGTAARPIVFTPREFQRTNPFRFWRGLVLLGSASTSFTSFNATVGNTGTGSDFEFGGAEDDDDCGTLNYVRVESAGEQPNEYWITDAACITFAGCGSATTVDYVQAHLCAEGIGIVGGTVNLRHVVVDAADEDAIEVSAGYRGVMQYGVIQQWTTSGNAVKLSGFDTRPDATPLTDPEIFNFTLVGITGPDAPTGNETGILIQTGARGRFRNGLIDGFPGPWVDVASPESAAAFVSGAAAVTQTFFSNPIGMGNNVIPDDTDSNDRGPETIDENAIVRMGSNQNRIGFDLGPEYDPARINTVQMMGMRPNFYGSTVPTVLQNPSPPMAPMGFDLANYHGALSSSAVSTTDEATNWVEEGTLAAGQAWTNFAFGNRENLPVLGGEADAGM